MSWATIRGALQTRLDAVTGVDQVHTYWRWHDGGPEEAAWRALFVSGTTVQAWMITRAGMPRTLPATPAANLAQRWLRRHDVEIHCFYRWQDSSGSQNVFQDLLDAIEADLRTGDRTLGGVAVTHSLPEVQTPTDEGAALGGELCHRALIRLTVEELLT